jgi:single-stranded-DNA-specific exonuclease
LLAETGITQGKIFSDDVGFQLGPKINAVGRMASADLAVRLLVSVDQDESVKLARKLQKINNERKDRCKENLEYALTLIDRQKIVADQCCIILGPFHQGVLGIIASRLVEIFRVPVIILTEVQRNGARESMLRGSCRSLEHYNMMRILRECEDILLAFGGHAFAAGISLHQDNLLAFRQRCRDTIKSFSFEKLPSTTNLHIDFSIQKALKEVHLKLFHLMEPLGKGNERPVFRDCNAKVVEYRRVGQNGEHLQATFRSDSGGCKGIGFNLGERAEVLNEQRTCEVVYSVTPSRFNGRVRWQIQILDLQLCAR